MPLHRASTFFTTSTTPCIVATAKPTPGVVSMGTNGHTLPLVPSFGPRRKSSGAAAAAASTSSSSFGAVSKPHTAKGSSIVVGQKRLRRGDENGRCNDGGAAVIAVDDDDPWGMKGRGAGEAMMDDEEAAFYAAAAEAADCHDEVHAVSYCGGDGQHSSVFHQVVAFEEDEEASTSTDDEGGGDISHNDDLRGGSNTNNTENPFNVPIAPYERLELALLLALAQDLPMRGSAEGEGEAAAVAAGEAAARMGMGYLTHQHQHQQATIHSVEEVDDAVLREWTQGMEVPFRHHRHTDSTKADVINVPAMPALSARQQQQIKNRNAFAAMMNGGGGNDYAQPSPSSTKGKVYCLNKYNEVKDVAQHVFGLVAAQRGQELAMLYFEQGISEE